MKTTYTIKKRKDGDVEVTEHGITRQSSLRETLMSYAEVKTKLKEMDAQSSLWKAGIKACRDHKDTKKVVMFFENLSKQDQAMLTEYLSFKDKLSRHDKAMSAIRRDATRMSRFLSAVHKLLPKEKPVAKKK